MLNTRDATLEDVRALLGETLGLENSRTAAMTRATPLLNSVPELDSFAIVQLVAALEERFGLTLEDEDLTADLFATLGSLTTLVDEKRAS